MQVIYHAMKLKNILIKMIIKNNCKITDLPNILFLKVIDFLYKLWYTVFIKIKML